MILIESSLCTLLYYSYVGLLQTNQSLTSQINQAIKVIADRLTPGILTGILLRMGERQMQPKTHTCSYFNFSYLDSKR